MLNDQPILSPEYTLQGVSTAPINTPVSRLRRVNSRASEWRFISGLGDADEPRPYTRVDDGAARAAPDFC